MPTRLSFTTAAVLKALADGSRYGFDVMEAAGLPSGTVYPILGRLEEGGYVRSQWESAAIAQKARRPARRYYEITAAGRRALADSLEHYRTLGGRIPVNARPAKARG
jgi:DNA-binding PadR family transcriptional regulator